MLVSLNKLVALYWQNHVIKFYNLIYLIYFVNKKKIKKNVSFLMLFIFAKYFIELKSVSSEIFKFKIDFINMQQARLKNAI